MTLKINTDKPYRIFAEHLEQGALDQFESAMQESYAIQGALMPDAHTGYSLPIGAVVATDGVIVPAWIGYDIGCGMCALPTSYAADQVRENAQAIFEGIYHDIPVGFSHNQRDTPWAVAETLPRSDMLRDVMEKNGLRQLGSLGGGNHFIEIGADEHERVWVIIHSGSRGVGHAIASHYMRLAGGEDKVREGHFGFDTNGVDGQAYVTDMNYCLEFALENRREMMRRVTAVMSTHCEGAPWWDGLINRNHNHAELRDGLWIHRKGATHAEEGMMGVIPGNMRDGSFIVRGRGCEDALWSSSHGAGRVLGRKEAQRVLTMDAFADTMHGVTARVTTDTLD